MKFESGKTYYATSICDSNCRWEFTVTKRTDKSIWINDKRFSVNDLSSDEFIFPLGRYSMAPMLRASREVD